MHTYDVLVIGGGAAGSATAWQLAHRGQRVALLERFGPGHRQGSSHGRSRLLRLTYLDALYAGLVAEAMDRWRALEAEAGQVLMTRVGAVDAGPADRLTAMAASLSSLDLPHELVDQATARQRWPQLRLPGDLLVQPDAARLDADATVAALQRRAAELGAHVRHNSPVTALEVDADGVRAHTPAGVFAAPVAVTTVGAWTADLLADLVTLPTLTVTQEQVMHLTPTAGVQGWPAFSMMGADGQLRYGIPTADEGVKVSEHRGGHVVTADGRDGDLNPRWRDRMLAFVREYLPGLEPTPHGETTCLYTNTEGEDFVLDRVGPLVVGTACSGHGFKFTPLLGAMLADLALGTGEPHHRFRLPTPAARPAIPSLNASGRA